MPVMRLEDKQGLFVCFIILIIDVHGSLHPILKMIAFHDKLLALSSIIVKYRCFVLVPETDYLALMSELGSHMSFMVGAWLLALALAHGAYTWTRMVNTADRLKNLLCYWCHHLGRQLEFRTCGCISLLFRYQFDTQRRSSAVKSAGVCCPGVLT